MDLYIVKMAVNGDVFTRYENGHFMPYCQAEADHMVKQSKQSAMKPTKNF